VALSLKSRGITQVRPLLGGLEAWSRLGYPLEVITAGTALEGAALVVEPAADSSASTSSLSLGGH
jgi:3-mercaptopyruvate sulfurtransferase SseA